MTKLTMIDLSNIMRKLDVCMMTTRNADDMLESRPMSNNKDVDYQGDSYFFTLDSMQVVRDLSAHPEVCLVYEGRTHMFTSSIYICISGEARLSQDRATMQRHWMKDLEKWFKQGLNTPGLTLIQVKARHIKYWDGYEEGEVDLPQSTMRMAG